MTVPRWELVFNSAATDKRGNCREFKVAILPTTTAQDVWEAAVHRFFPKANFDKLQLAAAVDVETAVLLTDMLPSLKTSTPDQYMMPDQVKQEAYLIVKGGPCSSPPTQSASVPVSEGGQKAVKSGRNQGLGGGKRSNKLHLTLEPSTLMRDVSRLLLPRSSQKAKEYTYRPYEEMPQWARHTVIQLTCYEQQGGAQTTRKIRSGVRSAINKYV